MNVTERRATPMRRMVIPEVSEDFIL